jgi:hypothetical protein
LDINDAGGEMVTMMMIGALTLTVAPSKAQVCRARWHSASPRRP